MEEKKEESVAKQYVDAIVKKVEAAQESGDIPTMYSYELNQKQWVITLPRSVMAQKRLMHIRNEFLQTGSYEAEEALLNMILQNTSVSGHQVGINELEYNELEVLKTAYLDELLLPLSLGGDKAVGNYMAQVLGKSPKA